MKIVYHDEHNIDIIDINKAIECAECHKTVTVGACYSSFSHFYRGGIWAMNVCPECYEKELAIMKEERHEHI